MKLKKFLIFTSLCAVYSNFCWALMADYTVPVQSPHNTFSISDMSLQESEQGSFDMKYTLPKELVGPGSEQVHFRASADHSFISGSMFKFHEVDGDGWALCQQASAAMSCTIEYEDTSYDRASRDQFLQNNYANDPDHLEDLLRIAHAFDGDPIGVLNITLLLEQ